MEFLRFLEGMRLPFLDVLFSLITRMGEETLFIVVGILCFWCISKRHGYYILSVGFLGTVINQFLKLSFRIPRPEKLSPGFTIVESAREAAEGFSFPSGHTQTAAGLFGCIAVVARRRAVTIVAILLTALVAFSRMYLGVHTPLDVVVSLAVAVILVLGMHPLLERAVNTRQGMLVFFSGMLVLSLAFLLFVLLFPFPLAKDDHNYISGLKAAYKILGCVLGIFLAYLIEDRYIRFETRASLPIQAMKLILGLIPLLAIKEGLRAPLKYLFGEALGGGVRYLLVAFFAAAIWPLTFKGFARLDRLIKARKKQGRAKTL